MSSDIVKSNNFETGVVKLQSGKSHDLVDHEKQSVKALMKPSSPPHEEDEHSECYANFMAMKERLSKSEVNNRPVAATLIAVLFSALVSEVERLWSIAKNELASNRRSMTLQNFEYLVFLKVSERFWDETLVCKAINGARSERAKELLHQHELDNER